MMDPHPMLGAGSRGLIARRDLAAGEVIACIAAISSRPKPMGDASAP